MSDLKPGDRVRVTYEGVVDRQDSNFYLTVKTDRQLYKPFLNDPAVTIEKLSDPEPAWTNGDSISFKGSILPPLYRHLGRWHWTSDGELSEVVDDPYVSDHWRRGEVKIVHRVGA